MTEKTIIDAVCRGRAIDENGLLPCAHCGGKAMFTIGSPKPPGHYVMCTNGDCNMATAMRAVAADAAQDWNRRTDTAPVAQQPPPRLRDIVFDGPDDPHRLPTQPEAPTLADDLPERLRSWAQNEEMIDSYYTAHGKDCNEAAARIESDAARIRALEADARRIDFLEAGIRDGSYLSIFNDIIAACRHAYAIVGPGPALRTVIDGVIASLATPDSAASPTGGEG